MKNVMVKSLLAVSLVAVGMNVQAMSSSALQGVYFSLGTGVMNLHQNLDYKIDIGPGYDPVNDVMQQHLTPGLVRFGIGYGMYFQHKYYAAVEAAYSFVSDTTFSNKMTTKIKNTDFYSTNQTSANHLFELNALFGYVFPKQILGFVKLGYAHLSTTNHLLFQQDGYLNDPWVQYNYNQSLNGLLLGLGVRLPITAKLQLAGEYNYINYGTSHHKATLVNVNYAGSTENISVDESNKVHSNNFVASLIYTI